MQYTTDVLFRDLWLRPDLALGDRSLVTVAALIATGQVAQITFHLNKAMDNGLTSEQAGEVVTHLAFYSGWPNAFSAVSVVKDVIEKRNQTSPTKQETGIHDEDHESCELRKNQEENMSKRPHIICHMASSMEQRVNDAVWIRYDAVRH